MSILIKGMEMPKRCADCYISEHDCCPLLHQWCSINSRNKDCPLVEVPKHGRLIDADELTKRWTANGDYPNCIYDGAFVVLTIDTMPTIIEAEE